MIVNQIGFQLNTNAVGHSSDELRRISSDVEGLDATSRLPKGFETQELYITTNEIGVQGSLEVLRAQTNAHGNCHIGVSGLFNFSIAAATNPKIAILIEINKHMVAINRLAINLLKIAPDAQQFAKSFANALMEQEDFFYTKHSIGAYNDDKQEWEYVPQIFSNIIDFDTMEPVRDNLTDDKYINFIVRAFTGAHSAFESPESFNRLQTMAQEGRLVAIGVDLADTAQIKRIADVVHRAGLKFGTIYASNVYEYITAKSPKKKQDFCESIDLLASPDTLIIDGLSHNYTPQNITDVHQNIFYKQDPQSRVVYNPDYVRNLLEDGKFEPNEELRLSRYPKAPLIIEMPRNAYDPKQ